MFFDFFKKNHGAEDTATHTDVISPFQGTVLKCRATEGQRVVSGNIIFTISSSGIEHEIYAPYTGIILKILAKEDAYIKSGGKLCAIAFDA